MTKPIFLISLPRSGSTLLQRILAVHVEVSTSPEPWVLLPLGYVVKGRGAYAEYGHSLCVSAISDFVSTLPGGPGDYREAIRRYSDFLYSRASGGKRYFLDKTPRYSLIATQLLDLYPDARFVFLYRNPLAVLASMKATWRLSHLLRVDLYSGLSCLVEAARKAGSDAYCLRYEDLVANPDEVVKGVCSYLEIEFQPKMTSEFAQVSIPEGAFGNPLGAGRSGTTDYSAIVDLSLNRWLHELSKNPLRKRSALRYLEWVGRDRLETMGYVFDDLQAALRGQKTGFSGMGWDAIEIMRGIVSAVFETHMLRDKLQKLPNYRAIYAHR